MRRVVKEQIDQEYSWVNNILKDCDISFMNHGYAGVFPEISIADPFRNQKSLYLYVASLLKINSFTRMLEIGSGRGGGLNLLSTIYKPAVAIGLDQNHHNIAYSKLMHKNVEFVLGDAENLPFDDESFDLVINIESAHCYPNIGKFMTESARVLIRGGVLAIADTLFMEDDLLVGDYSNNAARVLDYGHLFKIETYDITAEVLESCRQNMIEFPSLSYPKEILDFISYIPKKMYDGYFYGKTKYLVHICRKVS